VTKLRWTTQAVEDVEAIGKFIANDSDAYADLVVARLLEAVERLELFPRSG
jgi:plasmid stabilization system protein ParE